jgi:pyridoxamine-phosphate oxidase
MMESHADFEKPPANPLSLMKYWIDKAEKANVIEPRSLVLSTIEDSRLPSSRVVLMTNCDDTGVIFGTSEKSNKGKAIAVNPWVAGTLWWRETLQQINFRGKVSKLSDKESDNMFHERPRAGQVVTILASQSEIMEDEKNLREKIIALTQSDIKIERPIKWHGYHIAIEMIEFWQNDDDRLHKRLRYDLIQNKWEHQILQP